MARLNEKIKRHLSENIWLYSVIMFFFVFGACLGALTVNNISGNTSSQLKSYVQGFLNITSSDGVYSIDILKQSIKLNIATILLLFLSGLTFVGLLTIPIIAGFRGFCTGFTVAFLTQGLGKGGYLLSLVSILPQNIIYIPVIIVMCVSSFCLALVSLRNKYLKKRRELATYIMPYLTNTIIIFLIMLTGSIVEAYLTPFLVKFIVPYVV